MKKSRIPTLLIIALVIITALVAYHYKRRAIYGGVDYMAEPNTNAFSAPVFMGGPLPPQPDKSPPTPTTAKPEPGPAIPKIKRNVSEYGPQDKMNFQTNFEKKYKPAIDRWCQAYQGHTPDAVQRMTAANFVSSVGNRPGYCEYIFVLDSVTLGVRDSSRSGVSVDYLNSRPQTSKMLAMPDGSEAPRTDSPVSGQDIAQMVKTDAGQDFPARDIRITPSGFSGRLNGGAIVEVGGDPDNSVTWKYNLVFGPDGLLAYFLKGHD